MFLNTQPVTQQDSVKQNRKYRTVLQKLLVYKKGKSLWTYTTELEFKEYHELSHGPAGVGGPPIEKHWYKLFSKRSLYVCIYVCVSGGP
jgi:hypothetical protein